MNGGENREHMKNEGEQRNTYIVGTMEPLFGEKRTKGVNMKWAGEHRKEIVGIRDRNQRKTCIIQLVI